jgi:hypothetical protein
MRKRTTIVGCIAVVILLVSIGVGLYIVNADIQAWVRFTFTKDMSFDSATWKAGDPALRSRMTWDLVARQNFLMTEREQVIDLLGEPDDRSEDESCRVGNCVAHHLVGRSVVTATCSSVVGKTPAATCPPYTAW